ncbi:(Fe-S)-binding protein [Desulfosarcina ovata]|uniref:Glycolate oxidase iron-sulfur subunit n=1 Tax=Desulfosarcina ovata subsp. ovata TaxID=2752305 RepID=A0A5K8A8F4_9BACT|nr:(Fe-S)-binding protein [Desulfosarcina ovata]BBO88817.1 glycolate oxidase iron-sulfur subunit [Desulfosarcina ovata subsp. ovata]
MIDLHKLAAMLQELDDQMVTCMKCGMCQAVCPVFRETLREADVTRGKIALLENLAHEMVADAHGVQEKLNKCLLCGSCQANCPSGVTVIDIFIKARIIVNSYLGLPAAKKVIFKGMLTRPRLFNALVAMGEKFQGLFSRPADELLGSSCSKVMSPLIGDRHFLPLAEKPLRMRVPELNTPAGRSGLKVAFFPGCVIDKMLPRIGEAVLKVLDYHGVGVYLPPAQACCGIPAVSSGDSESFEKLVRLNARAFARGEFDYLVTACATCTATIKEIWPKFMDAYPPGVQTMVRKLADKTMDINQFLVDRVGVRSQPAPTGGRRVTYHDPCHLKKSLGVSAQPRTLLQANPAFNFVEMNEADQCCGNGGTFNLQHYAVSKKIGDRKRGNILASKAEVVATGCPACMMQMTDMLSQHGDRVQVCHPVEIYAQALK